MSKETKQIPKSKWPMVRINPECHQALIKSSAIEAGKRKKPISLIRWTTEVVIAGLKKFGY